MSYNDLGLSDEGVVEIVGYAMRTAKCAYCHYKFDEGPTALSLTEHLCECIPKREAELKKANIY